MPPAPFAWPWPTRTFRSPLLPPASAEEAGPTDRQDLLAGFSSAALRAANLLLIGAGGLGSAIATALIRKGVGHLSICDHDFVERSNLCRQSFFAPEDLHLGKAAGLAKNAAREGCLGARVVSHEVAFAAASADRLSRDVRLAIVAVDNETTRLFATQFFRQKKIPVIFTAVSTDADYCWCFLQAAAGACLCCVFPDLPHSGQAATPCAATPAALDILRLAGALVTRTVDSVLMPKRATPWNFRSFSFVDGAAGQYRLVKVRPLCPMRH